MFAMEFAAVASLPRCPMMTVYMENPTPHTSSFPSTGRVYLQKSLLRRASVRKRARRRSLQRPSLKE